LLTFTHAFWQQTAAAVLAQRARWKTMDD